MRWIIGVGLLFAGPAFADQVLNCSLACTETTEGACEAKATELLFYDTDNALEYRAKTGRVYARFELVAATQRGSRVFAAMDGPFAAALITLGPDGNGFYSTHGVDGNEKAATSIMECTPQ